MKKAYIINHKENIHIQMYVFVLSCIITKESNLTFIQRSKKTYKEKNFEKN